MSNRKTFIRAAMLLPLALTFAHAETITLDQALIRALESDERIEIQRREVSIAEREVDRAWTIISPRLTAAGRYDRPESEVRQDDRVLIPEDAWSATITATQPLFDGRVLPARRLGIALERAEAETLVHAIRLSLFDVSQIYFGVLSSAKQVELAQQTVSLSTQEVARAKARFDAGEARRTELLRAEVDEARARRNLVAAVNAYDVARADLARRLGLDADYEFEVEAPAPMAEPESEVLRELFLQALDQRNDLIAARLQIDSASEQRDVIRREAWPTLELQYNHSFVDPESTNRRNNWWEIAAVARYEFWDGGSRRISRLQQDDRITQAELQVADLEKSIQLEVQQALLELLNVREDLVALRKEVALAEENYRTLSEQARVGLATSLDVSTALNELDFARTELARQEYQFEIAKLRVELATGQFASDYIEVNE